ncbi:hypothetical protein DFJ73DRAFT_781346 [Zopfochytrium polystomum]|nr:hypothetical protein DFJ73DRAFT_781346 [Zopfochytrium polystomum]
MHLSRNNKQTRQRRAASTPTVALQLLASTAPLLLVAALSASPTLAAAAGPSKSTSRVLRDTDELASAAAAAAAAVQSPSSPDLSPRPPPSPPMRGPRAVPCTTNTDVTWDVAGSVWKRRSPVPDRFNSNGRYFVLQAVRGDDMNFVKFRVFQDLVTEVQPCVGYVREASKLRMVMNASDPETCPDKFDEYYGVCGRYVFMTGTYVGATKETSNSGRDGDGGAGADAVGGGGGKDNGARRDWHGDGKLGMSLSVVLFLLAAVAGLPTLE